MLRRRTLPRCFVSTRRTTSVGPKVIWDYGGVYEQRWLGNNVSSFLAACLFGIRCGLRRYVQGGGVFVFVRGRRTTCTTFFSSSSSVISVGRLMYQLGVRVGWVVLPLLLICTVVSSAFLAGRSDEERPVWMRCYTEYCL